MRIVAVLLVLVLLGLQARLWHGAGSVAELRQLREQTTIQQAENDELRLRNDAVRNDVKDLRDGLDAVEERARNELGLIKPGETFFRIVPKSE
jgi:cell division protein FtsB